LIRAALAAVDAGHLVDRTSAARDVWAGERPVRLVAAGKAAAAMSRAAVRRLGNRLQAGLVVSPTRVTVDDLENVVGGHPVPTSGSEEAGRRAIAIARSTGPDELLLVLISGGASALMSLPASGVTLEDKRQTTDRLLRAGADIHALNTVRKHLSAIKGGWLAAACAGGTVTMAISDVVGDDPSVIASGPTVADRSTFADALDVLRRYGGEQSYPRNVVAWLDAGLRGGRPETPKPGDRRLSRAQTSVIGTRHDAMQGAAAAADARGYTTRVIDSPVVGEARGAGHEHVRRIVQEVAALPRPLCVVSSGETTVRVSGTGQGGRNQELSLTVADIVASLGAAAFASVGTDGVDGPTDAAGAIVDATTLARAGKAGLSVTAFLDNNDTYAFFGALGDLVRTGPTGTNVGDLQILLLG
jgi:hydroxypyruvate reductase